MNENLTYQAFIDNILQTRGRFNCGDEYHERHHIVPKCLGGTNDEDNLIDLFAREHFEAHRLLALEHPEQHSLQYAWFMMSNCNTAPTNHRYMVTAQEYEEAKKSYSRVVSLDRKGMKFSEQHRKNISKAQKGKIISEETRRKMRENHADYSNGKHPMFGKHHTEESKAHMSAAQQNRSLEWRKRQSNAQKGKHYHTQEWKDKMSERNSGENNPNYGNHKLIGGNNPNARAVECDGVVFDTLTECVKYLGLASVGNFSAFLNGTKPMPQKWIDRGLKWH